MSPRLGWNRDAREERRLVHGRDGSGSGAASVPMESLLPIHSYQSPTKMPVMTSLLLEPSLTLRPQEWPQHRAVKHLPITSSTRATRPNRQTFPGACRPGAAMGASVRRSRGGHPFPEHRLARGRGEWGDRQSIDPALRSVAWSLALATRRQLMLNRLNLSLYVPLRVGTVTPLLYE